MLLDELKDEPKVEGDLDPTSELKEDHMERDLSQLASNLDLEPMFTSMPGPSTYDEIVPIIIDSKGTFKYILIEIKDPNTGSSMTVIRGHSDCEYHKDIFKRFVEKEMSYQAGSMVLRNIKEAEIEFDVLGGGTLTVDRDDKTIEVGGTSIGYGKADYWLTRNIIKRADTENRYNITLGQTQDEKEQAEPEPTSPSSEEEMRNTFNSSELE